MRKSTSESLLGHHPRDEPLNPRDTSCVRTPVHEKTRAQLRFICRGADVQLLHQVGLCRRPGLLGDQEGTQIVGKEWERNSPTFSV